MTISKLRDLKFSVSMAVYKNDHPIHFKQAVDSVLSQTIIPSELILVIDGPIPIDIKEIISDYTDKNDNFRTVWLEKNMGHGHARRVGLENCKFELVALMDSDDICLPDRFEKQLKCFAFEKSISIVGGAIQEFQDNVKNIVGIRTVPELDNEIKSYMKVRCPMNQMTVMFKKSEVIKAGGYLDWHFNEDYYLWIRMLKAGCTFKNLKDILVSVRVSTDLYKRRGGWKYFISEAKLQKYMMKETVISIYRYLLNVSVRFIVQVLVPNNAREFMFKTFFRTSRNGK